MIFGRCIRCFLPLCLLLIPFSLSAQSIVSVSPDSAYQGENLAVTISGQGTHFGQGSQLTQVWLSQASITTIYPLFNIIQSTTLLDAHFSIPQNANLGLWDVNVWTPFDGHMQMGNGFLIYEQGVGLPPEIETEFATLQIFPNPLSDASVARFTLGNQRQVAIAIYDLEGKQVLRVGESELGAGPHEVALRPGTLASGTYLLKLSFDDVLYVQRVSVHR